VDGSVARRTPSATDAPSVLSAELSPIKNGADYGPTRRHPVRIAFCIFDICAHGHGRSRRSTLAARRPDDDRRRDGAVDHDRMGPGRQRVQKRDPAVPDGKARRPGR
jgi:hypothetical protein